MNKLNDVQVLRLMLAGRPLTAEQCEVWEIVRNRITEEKERHFQGYQLEYVINRHKVSSVAKDLIKRHLITPEVSGDKQTFTVTETGRIVAITEQQEFGFELPNVVEYA